MINIVFFGTPAIALKSLEHLYNSEKINVLAVVTQPDKPAGRGHKMSMSVLKQFAIEHNLPVFQPKSIRKEPEIQEELKELKPDFFVTFAFGQILSQEVLDIPKYETINLHASLLPRYRGANPIQRAIINGDKETGICTMITELGLDCGDVCMREKIEIPDNMTCVDLFERISVDSPALLEKTLIGLVDKTISPEKQCETGVCMANKLIKEYLIKGYNLNVKRFKNNGGGTYFEEVLEKIRDIRSSEKVFWRKILDIYATSVDYDAKSEQTREFFKTVQNKMHYAVHGNTAAEVIFNRVDSEKENIGLTNFKGNMLTRAETEIAKNYLSEKELDLLNRMVSAYLDVAEINALNMHAMTMKDWVKELDGFLTMTHKDILEGAGTISHEKALEKAHKEYDKYMRNHLTQAEKDYLEIMGEDIKKLK